MQQSSSNQHNQHINNMAENIDKFMEFCKKQFKKKSSECILKLVRKRFDECRTEYKMSSDFEELLLMTQEKIRTGNAKIFVHLRDFLNILKDNTPEPKDHGTSKRERVHSESDSSKPTKMRKVDSCSKNQNNQSAYEHNDHISGNSGSSCHVTDHNNLSDSAVEHENETSVHRHGTDKSYNTYSSDAKQTINKSGTLDNIVSLDKGEECFSGNGSKHLDDKGNSISIVKCIDILEKPIDANHHGDVKSAKLVNDSDENIYKEPVVQPKNITNLFHSNYSTNVNSEETVKAAVNIAEKTEKQIHGNDSIEEIQFQGNFSEGIACNDHKYSDASDKARQLRKKCKKKYVTSVHCSKKMNSEVMNTNQPDLVISSNLSGRVRQKQYSDCKNKSSKKASVIVISDSESSSSMELSESKLDPKFDETRVESLPVNDESNKSYKFPEDVSDSTSKQNIDHDLPTRVESLPINDQSSKRYKFSEENFSDLAEFTATAIDTKTTPVHDMSELKNDISATAHAKSIATDATVDHVLKSVDGNKIIIRPEPLTSLENRSNISTDYHFTKTNEDKIISDVSENIVQYNKDIDENQKKSKQLDNNSSKLTVQDFKDDLKATEQPEITSSADGVSGGSKKKKGSAQQIRKLEILLEKLKNKIEQVRAKELCLDDLDSEVSDYILEDKLKQKFMKVWNKLCELNEVPATTDRPIDKYFRFQGTRYKAINRRIEKFINRKKVFPDYHDIRDIVVKVNKKKQLNLRLRDIDDLSREAFTDIGNQLQIRRQKDFILTIQPSEAAVNLTSTYDDPALFDHDLKKQLDANRKIGTSKMEQVIQKYTQLQYQVGDKTDSDEGEQEEEEETELHKDSDLDAWLDISDTEAHTSSTNPFPIMEIENAASADLGSVDGYQFEYLDKENPSKDSPLSLKEDTDIQDHDGLTSKNGPDPIRKGEQKIINNLEPTKCKQIPVHITIDSEVECIEDECIEDECIDMLVKCSKHRQKVSAGDEPVKTINQLSETKAYDSICKDIMRTMVNEKYMSDINATDVTGDICKNNVAAMEGACKTNITAVSDEQSLDKKKCFVSDIHDSRPLEDLVCSTKKRAENKPICQDDGHSDNVKYIVSDHSNSILSPSMDHIAATVKKSHSLVEDEEICSVSDIFEDLETEECTIEPGDKDDHSQKEYPSIMIENIVGNVVDLSEPFVERKGSLDCVIISETDKNDQTLEDNEDVLDKHNETPVDSTYTRSDLINEDEMSSTINPETAVKLKHPDVRNKLLLLNKAIVDTQTESEVTAKFTRTTKSVCKVKNEAQWIEDDENAGLIETYQEPDCTPTLYIIDDSTVSSPGQGDVIVLSDSE